MNIKPLYRFKREDGGITVSPIKPDGEYTEKVRMIADEGKAITKDGENFYSVIDADSAEGYYEVEAPMFEREESLSYQYAAENG